jgi:hypothetical protein
MMAGNVAKLAVNIESAKPAEREYADRALYLRWPRESNAIERAVEEKLRRVGLLTAEATPTPLRGGPKHVGLDGFIGQ